MSLVQNERVLFEAYISVINLSWLYLTICLNYLLKRKTKPLAKPDFFKALLLSMKVITKATRGLQTQTEKLIFSLIVFAILKLKKA